MGATDFVEFVLFVNGSLGDFLMYVHLAELLHESYSRASVRIVLSRNASFLRSLLGAYPYISITEVSRKHLGEVFHLIFGPRPRAVAVSPTIGRIPLGIKVLAWAVGLGRGGLVIGFQDKGPFCRALYGRMLHYDTDKPYLETVHEMARIFGVPAKLPPRLKCGGTDILEKLGLTPGNYVAFHSGAAVARRMFSVEAAVDIVRHIAAQNIPVVLVGGPEDQIRITEINARANVSVVLAIGLPAPELCDIIAGACLFIGTDTGTTHLACFLGKPALVVAHYGTANWLPFYAPEARILYRLEEDIEANEGLTYLEAHRRGRSRPFKDVPTAAVLSNINTMLNLFCLSDKKETQAQSEYQ